MKEISNNIANEKSVSCSSVVEVSALETLRADGALAQAMVCPNCGCELQGRKCKLLCVRPGCGYQVTCSEW